MNKGFPRSHQLPSQLPRPRQLLSQHHHWRLDWISSGDHLSPRWAHWTRLVSSCISIPWSPLLIGSSVCPFSPWLLPLLSFLVDEIHFWGSPEHLFLDPVSLVTWSQNFRSAEFFAVTALVHGDQTPEASRESRWNWPGWFVWVGAILGFKHQWGY